MHDIKTYRLYLEINKHRLDDELELQPMLMERISSQLTILNSRMIEAADDLKRAEAQAFADAKSNEDVKMSDRRADMEVRDDPRRREAWQKWQAARSEHELWQGLYEAWKARGWTLKELANLYVAQYFAIDSTTTKDTGTRPRVDRIDYTQQQQPARVDVPPQRIRRERTS